MFRTDKVQFVVIISIPSGTIKRHDVPGVAVYVVGFQFLLVRLKAYMVDIGSDLQDIFQFLLVRLKVKTAVFLNHFANISIPSGTIKSRPYEGSFFSVTQFQFLLVRLKDVAPQTIKECKADFNSFWYD